MGIIRMKPNLGTGSLFFLQITVSVEKSVEKFSFLSCQPNLVLVFIDRNKHIQPFTGIFWCSNESSTAQACVFKTTHYMCMWSLHRMTEWPSHFQMRILQVPLTSYSNCSGSAICIFYPTWITVNILWACLWHVSQVGRDQKLWSLLQSCMHRKLYYQCTLVPNARN